MDSIEFGLTVCSRLFDGAAGRIISVDDHWGAETEQDPKAMLDDRFEFVHGISRYVSNSNWCFQ